MARVKPPWLQDAETKKQIKIYNKQMKLIRQQRENDLKILRLFTKKKK